MLPEEWGGPRLTWVPQPRAPVSKRSPQNICLWMSAGIPSVRVRWRASGNHGVLLKGPCIDSHSQALTRGPGGGQKVRGHQWHTRRNQVIWLQGEGWRNEQHCPCIEPSYYKARSLHHLSYVEPSPSHSQIWACISLVNTIPPTLITPWGATHPTLCTAPGFFGSRQQGSELTAVFYDHDGVKLEINYKEKDRKTHKHGKTKYHTVKQGMS